MLNLLDSVRLEDVQNRLWLSTDITAFTQLLIKHRAQKAGCSIVLNLAANLLFIQRLPTES